MGLPAAILPVGLVLAPLVPRPAFAEGLRRVTVAAGRYGQIAGNLRSL